MGKTYRGGGYEVTVGDDRSIVVQPGDWLSKYSMAIYGDFDHIARFKQKIGPNQYRAVPNPDLIRVGEVLYHPDPLPDESAIPPGEGVPGSEPQMQSRHVSDFLAWFMNTFVRTEWEVAASGGGDISASFFTAQYATVHVRRTASLEPSPVIKHRALGLGLTLGWPEDICVGASFATVEFPSWGTILRSPFYRRLAPKDFSGGILVLEFGTAFYFGVLGGSASVILFGMGFPPTHILRQCMAYYRHGDLGALQSLIFNAQPSGALIVAGGIVGIPGVGVAGRVGYMTSFFG